MPAETLAPASESKNAKNTTLYAGASVPAGIKTRYFLKRAAGQLVPWRNNSFIVLRIDIAKALLLRWRKCSRGHKNKIFLKPVAGQLVPWRR